MTADIEIDCLDLVRTLGQDEQIIYRPAAGRPRAMYAVVSRASDGPMPQVPVSGRTTNIEVAVVNDVANGIELGELDTGQDRMDVAPRAGAARETKDITGILAADAGMIAVQVR